MNKKLILTGAAVIASAVFWWVAASSIKNIFALGLYAGFLINLLVVAEDPHDKRHGTRLVLLIKED